MHFKIILKIGIAVTLLISRVCMADDDTKWASDLRSSSLEMVWQNLKEQFEEQERLEIQTGLQTNGDDLRPRQFAGLYIFVSTGVPKPLLKAYLLEANKYGGVLVFKGLPNGSFKELTKLIIDLTGEERDLQKLTVNVQIDDAAYERFGISTVPTIVLAKEDDYHPSQTSTLKFDKMIGNVGIKYSLEEFSKSGELKAQALEHLK